MKKIILLILFSVLFSGSFVSGEKAPLLKNAYCGLEPGARASAMGGAFVAVGGDASCFYWNPAGLGLLPQPTTVFGFNDTKHIGVEDVEIADLLGTPTGLSGKRLSFIAFSENRGALSWRPLSNVCKDGIYEQHIEADGDTIEIWRDIEYSINEFALSMTTLTIATAQEIEGMPCILGMNIKYINGRMGVAEKSRRNGIWEEPKVNMDTGNGYSIDIGFLYSRKQIGLGFSVQNVLANLYWHDYSRDRINANLQAGIAFMPFNGFILASDIEKRWDDTPYIYHIGTEKTFMRRKKQRNDFGTKDRQSLKHWDSSIRLGVYGTNLFDKEKTIYTGGIGYSYSNYRVDTTVSGRYEGKDSKLSFKVTISIPFQQ